MNRQFTKEETRRARDHVRLSILLAGLRDANHDRSVISADVCPAAMRLSWVEAKITTYVELLS